MNERKWVADPQTGALTMYLYPYTGMSENATVVPEPENGDDKWDFNTSSFIRHLDPMVVLTEAVKALPVTKRTDTTWGLFLSQCLIAIPNGDMEALAYLIDGYQTSDPDYMAILAQAKTLFGLS